MDARSKRGSETARLPSISMLFYHSLLVLPTSMSFQDFGKDDAIPYRPPINESSRIISEIKRDAARSMHRCKMLSCFILFSLLAELGLQTWSNFWTASNTRVDGETLKADSFNWSELCNGLISCPLRLSQYGAISFR